MTRKYDAIVIGAGLGGMSAATMMARNGLSVLLLERHNIPGGYATSFVRGRYEFEIALHELSGIGPPERRGELYRYLDYLGVAEKVDFLQMKEVYRSILPGVDVTLPIGRENYENKLCETFPKEANGIRKFLKRIDQFNREIAEIIKARGIGNPVTAPFRYKTAIRYMTAKWGDVLKRDVKDPDARAVLSQYWGYFGVGPSDASFTIFAAGLNAYVKLGPWYVKGRSQTLSGAFVATFEELGGQVRYNCGVEKITTSNGRVTGVITEDQEEFEADYIVSNADPITTCRDMIPMEDVPSSFFDSMRSRNVAPSTVNLYMGINRSPEDLGFFTHENFVNADNDFDGHYRMARQIGDTPGVLVTVYNFVLPEISPPGTTMAVITSLSYSDPWIRLQPHEYVKTKTRIADSMLKLTEKICPDIRKYAEVLEVATPITNMRYAGAMGGSIYGFDYTPYDHSILRMSHRGPLGGLYFAGAWVQPGGGFEPCMFSGQMAGARIVKKFKKTRTES